LSEKLDVLDEIAGLLLEYLDFNREFNAFTFIGFRIDYDLIYELVSFYVFLVISFFQ